MENNYSFNIIKYWRFLFLRGLFIVFGIIFFTLFFLGANRGSPTNFYDRIGLTQKIQVLLMFIGGSLGSIIAICYFNIKCITGSIVFSQIEIKLSTKHVEKKVSYNECIINNKKLAVLDVENSLNPVFSTFTFDDNGVNKSIHFKIKIDDLYYLKQFLKEKQKAMFNN